MRKEVYKRKPKKAFDKIKKFEKDHKTSGLTPNPEASKTFHQLRFIPVYKRTWFRIALFLFFGTLISAYVWNVYFAENHYLGKVHQFQEEGIFEYFDTNQSAIDSVRMFVNEREGKILFIIKHFSGRLVIRIQSEAYDSHMIRKTIPKHLETSNAYDFSHQDRIQDGNLMIIRNKNTKTYNDYWAYDLHLNNINQVAPSFLNYLETDRINLDAILRIVSRKRWKISKYSYGEVFSFSHRYGEYDIVFSDSLPINTKEKKHVFGLIAANIHWERQNYYR